MIDHGSRSHQVGTAPTVKIVKDSYNSRHKLQWYVHGIYALLPVFCTPSI